MKTKIEDFGVLLLIILLICYCSKETDFPSLKGPYCKSAYEYFRNAQFDESLSLYKKALEKDINSFEANYRVGYIYKLSNKLPLAEKYLKKSLVLKPGEANLKKCLAEVYYRQDKYAEAALLYNDLGNEGKAKQLAAFGTKVPYKLNSELTETSIPFLMVNPLPRFYIQVNGKKIVVQLDTGGSELILDAEFAREIGADIYGSREAVFGGGQKSTIEYGKVKSIKLGDFKLENVPVHALRIGSTSFKGIVGTNVLYRFISTIDYPGKKLVLRVKGKGIDSKKSSGTSIKIPFWLEGDHFILAWGTANDSDSLLFIVDSGLAGGAFYFPVITAQKIGLKIDKNIVRSLHGGGGMFEYFPSKLDEMTLGNAKEKTLNGVVVANDGFSLHNRYEYTIDGIISHDFLKNYAVTFDFSNMIIYLVDE